MEPATRGFTLLEMMIVLTIFSLLLGVASLGFRPLWGKHQVRMATGDLIQRLQTLRIKAILDRRKYQVEIYNHFFLSHRIDAEWTQQQLNPGIQYHYSKVDTACQRFEIPKTIKISFSSAGSTTPITICLQYEQWYQKLILSSYGNIRTTRIR
ncbi:MAG: hypothetical protein COB67_11400 [SAR324 cluster bacterium]|uniref:Prepilin-type N-terminal cleavage/methylation domain-containing protein n=1 Tax=SAR324 cluster bacterium TaxID=2024889 RepID=A0A2A4SV79_9DELT|nr:MAG: hypothetical protein COB67_11400 [SAR324 cluster bacterium]